MTSNYHVRQSRLHLQYDALHLGMKLSHFSVRPSNRLCILSLWHSDAQIMPQSFHCNFWYWWQQMWLQNLLLRESGAIMPLVATPNHVRRVLKHNLLSVVFICLLRTWNRASTAFTSPQNRKPKSHSHSRISNSLWVFFFCSCFIFN